MKHNVCEVEPCGSVHGHPIPESPSFKPRKSMATLYKSPAFYLCFAFVLWLLCLRLGLLPFTAPHGHDAPSGNDISAPDRSRLAVKYAMINENFPDPCFIESDGTFYAFATRNSSTANIQVASAPGDNVRNWTYYAFHDALPDPGVWTAKYLNDVAVWAPSVVEVVRILRSAWIRRLTCDRTPLTSFSIIQPWPRLIRDDIVLVLLQRALCWDHTIPWLSH
jgi:hypothetical protein